MNLHTALSSSLPASHLIYLKHACGLKGRYEKPTNTSKLH